MTEMAASGALDGRAKLLLGARENPMSPNGKLPNMVDTSTLSTTINTNQQESVPFFVGFFHMGRRDITPINPGVSGRSCSRRPARQAFRWHHFHSREMQKKCQ